MATNYVQPGETISLASPYDRTSGQGAQVGSIFGVALGTFLSTVVGEFRVVGVWNLTKVGSQAWAVGEKIYWDNSNKRCTTDSAAGMLIGVATEVVASGAGDVLGKVRLNGSAASTAEGAQAAIVALTDSTGVSGSHDDTIADGLTAVAPAAYTAHSAGATPVTSAAATDLDTTAAAVANLRGVVASLVTDVTVQNQNDSDLAQKILEIRTALIAAGILTA